MNIIIHYPDIIHIEEKIHIESCPFFSLWLKIISNIEQLQSYKTIESFFEKFILYANGSRIYNPHEIIENTFTVIAVSVNKGTYLKDIIKYNSINNHAGYCSVCGSENIVYFDEGLILSDEDIAYCDDCFVKSVRAKAFNNIRRHEPFGDDHIIDIGLSGERDSTTALHFLSAYKNMFNNDLNIQCVFNCVGLGLYDDIRLASAGRTASHLGLSLKVNSVDVDLLSDMQRGCSMGSMEAKYCSLCSRLTGFREYGSYDNQTIYSATGAGTLEDNFVSRVYGLEAQDSHIRANRIYVLDGFSEDVLSLYAAVLNINYCIADCPMQYKSPHYFCRRFALNPIKSFSKWIYKKENVSDNIRGMLPFGFISPDYIVDYPYKCIRKSDGILVQFENLKFETVMAVCNSETDRNSNKCEPSERRFYEILERSELNWLIQHTGIWKEALDEKDFIQLNVGLNKNIEIINSKSMLLYYSKIENSVHLFPLNKVEEVIISEIAHKKNSIYNLLQIVSDENSFILAFSRLIYNNILIIDSEVLIDTDTEKENLVLFDKYQVMSEFIPTFRKWFSIDIENIEDIEDISKPNDISEDKVLLFIDYSPEEIECYVLAKGFKGKMLIVSMNAVTTIYYGCFNCYQKLFNVCGRKIHVDRIKEDKYTIEAVHEIISILNGYENINHDENLFLSINFLRKQKQSQRIKCIC